MTNLQSGRTGACFLIAAGSNGEVKRGETRKMLRRAFPYLPLSLLGNYNGNDPVTLKLVNFTYPSFLFYRFSCVLFILISVVWWLKSVRMDNAGLRPLQTLIRRS